MIKERGLNTHSKGEQVIIPLLPNKRGKRSGTMTMVTTTLLLSIVTQTNNFVNRYSPDENCFGSFGNSVKSR